MKPKLSFITTTEGFTISQDKYQPGWIMPYVHHHTYHEIYILESGERLVQVEDREFPATAYQATFFKSQIPHRSSGTSAFRGICICFEESYLDKFVTKAAKSQLMQCFQHTVADLTEKEYSEIKKIADNFIPFAKNNYVSLINLLDLLTTAVERTSPRELITVPNNAVEKSKLILKYIDDHFRTIKNAKEITELFGVSESYFFKSFKKEHGISPRQYINNLKLRHACQLLTYRKDRTAKTISSDCGFENYEHFMRLFKKKMGCTPIEYRANNNI